MGLPAVPPECPRLSPVGVTSAPDCFSTGPLLAPLRCVPGLRGLGRGSGVARVCGRRGQLWAPWHAAPTGVPGSSGSPGLGGPGWPAGLPRCGHRSWGHQPALPCLIRAAHSLFAQTHLCRRYLRPIRCLRPCVPCSQVPGLTRGPRVPGGLQAVGLGGSCSPPARVPVVPAGPVRLADLGGPSCCFISSWVLPREPPLAWGFLQELNAHWPG